MPVRRRSPGATAGGLGPPTRRVAPLIPAIVAAVVVLAALGDPALAVDPVPIAASPTVSPSATASPSAPATATPAPTPSASASAPPGLPATFVVTGKGYGHGVGLSQYGARGRALAGQDAGTILAHYFRGTTRKTLSASTQIRVLVSSGFHASRTNPLRIYGRGGAFAVDGIATRFPADALVRVWRDVEGTAGVWKLRVTTAAGSQLHLGRVSGALVIRASSAGTLQLDSKPSVNDTYRGLLRIHLGTSASVVNQLPLEHYLRGVVPMEMPSSWPAEALKAQAVAARSYAAKRLHPTTGTYDVYDDTRSQVYAGTRAERSTTNAAISATAGQVLAYGPSIANTFFHSTGGGATEHNENAWVSPTGSRVAGPIAYLRGSADVDPTSGKPFDAASPWAAWTTASFTRARLETILASDPRTSVGTLVSVTITHRGISGRVVRLAITGSGGTKHVSGEVFRQIVNKQLPSGAVTIRSTSFTLKATS